MSLTPADFVHLARAVALSREHMHAGEGGPFGAVIARDGHVLAEGWNQVTSMNDPTAHAEVMAIRRACRALGDFALPGATLYTSCEPCPMCLGAMLNAEINVLVVGARLADLQDVSGAFAFGTYSAERFAEMVGWRLQVISGILGKECIDLYRVSRSLTR